MNHSNYESNLYVIAFTVKRRDLPPLRMFLTHDGNNRTRYVQKSATFDSVEQAKKFIGYWTTRRKWMKKHDGRIVSLRSVLIGEIVFSNVI